MSIINYYQRAKSGRKQIQDALFNGSEVIQVSSVSSAVDSLADTVCIGVADGLSGSPQGELASYFWMAALSHVEYLNTQWLHHHQRVFNQQMEQGLFPHGCGTTLAAAQLNMQTGQAELLSVGDSRIYRIDKQGEWHLLSQDHNFLRELKLDYHEDDKQKYASLYSDVTSYLVADGHGFNREICRLSCTLKQGETLLLCTDGFTDITNRQMRYDLWQGIRTHKPSGTVGLSGIVHYIEQLDFLPDDVSVVCVTLGDNKRKD